MKRFGGLDLGGIHEWSEIKASVRNEKGSLSPQSHRGRKVNAEIDELELLFL